MSKLILQHRRGDKDAWLDEQSPIPAEGELVVQTAEGANSPVLKIGDGENKFADLPSVTKDVETAVATQKARLDSYFTRHDPDIPEEEQYSRFKDEIEDIRVRHGGTTATCAGEAVRAIDKDLQDLKASVQNFVDKEAVDGLRYENNMLCLVANGEQVGDAVGPITGGTGTGGNTLPTLQVSMTLYTSDLVVRGTEPSVMVDYYFTSFEVVKIEDETLLESTGAYKCKVTNTATGRTVTYVINAQGNNSVDVKPVLSEGQNPVTIECIDTYGVSRSRTVNVNVASLRIEPITNTNAMIFHQVNHQTGIDIRFKIFGSVDKTVTYKIIDSEGAQKTITTEHSANESGDESGYTIPLSYVQHGTNKFILTVVAGTGADALSETQEWEFIYAAEGNNNPALASTHFGKTDVVQGTNISIPYIIYDPMYDDTSAVTYTIRNGTDVTTTSQTAKFEQQVTWNTKKYPAGSSVEFEICYVRGTIEEGSYLTRVSKHVFNVESAPPVATTISNNLLLNLDSANRSNEQTNRDVWPVRDSGEDVGSANVTTTFTKFNWETNGWIPDDTNHDVALRVNGDATAVVNYQLFNTNNINPRVSGLTIELDFRVSNISTREAVPFICAYDNVGLWVTPQSAKLAADTVSVECNFKEDERVKVSFTVEREDSGTRFVSVYLNGTLSQIAQYSSDAPFVTAAEAYPIMHSTQCTFELYGLRVYNRCLSATEICNNYVANISDRTEQINVQSDNNIYKGKVVDVKAVADRIPCVYFTAPDGMPKKKGEKQTVWMDFTNPFDKTKDFKTVYANGDHYNHDMGGIKTEIDVQGTSSQGYVRKNWKIKFKKDDNEVQIPPYQHMDGEAPTNVFCLKVDYAEATGTHNTQNANFVETLYDEKAPPAKFKYDSNVRTTIAGFPCVIFERATPQDEYVFSSKANFNFDKGSEEAFGFFSDYTDSEEGKNWPRIISTECWEFCNNTSNPCNFAGPIDFEGKWMDDFEARFLNDADRYVDEDLTDWYGDLEAAEEDLQSLYDTIGALDKDAPDYEATKSRLEAEAQEYETTQVIPLRRYFETKSKFPQLHEWVRSTAWYELRKGVGDQLIKTDRVDSQASELEPHVIIDGTTYTHDTNAYRKAKFRAEFRQYFNLHYCLIYYIYTSVALMMDQRSKNMFLTRWTTIDDNGEVEEKWYPYFYDNDTCFGINNEGYLVYDYYHTDVDFQGGVPVYNGYYNVLWWNFRDAFDTEIRQLYRTLRSGKNRKLDYNKIIEQFTTHGSDMWSASIYNEDADYKYVSLARPDSPNHTEEYLYQVRGDGKLHLEYFLHNRLKFYDSKWGAEDYIDDKIVFRVNKPSAQLYEVSTDTYFGGGDGSYAEWTTPADSEETKTTVIGIRRITNSVTDSEVSLSIAFNGTAYDSTDIIVSIPEAGWNTYTVPTPEPGTYRVTFKNSDVDHKFYAVSATDDDPEIAASIAPDVVPPNPTITLTAFSRMQGGVRYKANGSTISAPLIEGFPQSFGENIDEQFADTETFVFGASELSSLGDLSAVYLSVADVSKASRLTELIIGNDNPLYCNKQLRQVGVGASNKLLHTLNVYNCKGLTKAINLSQCPAIKHVYATGSSIPSVTLPEAGYVETLDLPSTITTLTIHNQPNVYYKHEKAGVDGLVSTLRVRDSVTDIEDNLFNIRRLNISDCSNIDTLRLLYDCLGVEDYTQTRHPDSKLTYVTIDNVNIELTEDTGLEPLRALYQKFNLKSVNAQGATMDKLDIRGSCAIKSVFEGDVFGEVAAHFTEALKFSVEGSGRVNSTVYFYGDIDVEDIGPDTLLYELSTSAPYGTVKDPSSVIGDKQLTRADTQEHKFTFAGWSSAINKDNRTPDPSALTKILGNRNLFPAYIREVQTYPVHFKTGGELLYTVYVPYGGYASFDATLVPEDKRTELLWDEPGNPSELVPRNVASARPDAYTFTTWYPLNQQILKETTFDAQFLLLLEGAHEVDVARNLTNPTDATDKGYILEDNNLSITKYWMSTSNIDGNEVEDVIIQIPESLKIETVEYPVTTIGNTIDNGVVTGAFEGSTVELIVIPDSVTRISQDAFRNCYKLDTITLGEGITHIEYDAFHGCSNIKVINYDCISAVSHRVEGAASHPFDGCRSEQGYTVIVGQNVTNIPASLFYQSNRDASISAVSTLDLSNATSCTTINSQAFSGCNIRNIEFNTTVKPLVTIDSAAFDRNAYSTELELPEGLTTIRDRAFANWEKLKTVKLPSTLTTLGAGVFSRCPELEGFVITPPTAGEHKYKFDNANGILVTNSVQESEETLVACTTSTKITNSRLLKYIGAHACAGCTSPYLQTVNLPSTLSLIGSHAFQSCKTIKSFNASGCVNVTTLNHYTFDSCSELTTLQLPPNLTTILYRCFEKCSKLTELVIPATVCGSEALGYYAFNGCSSLERLTISAPEDVNENLVQLDSTTGNRYLIDKLGTDLQINVGWNIGRVSGESLGWCANLNGHKITIIYKDGTRRVIGGTDDV